MDKKDLIGMALCIVAVLVGVGIWSNRAPKPEIPTAVIEETATHETTTRFIVPVSKSSTLPYPNGYVAETEKTTEENFSVAGSMAVTVTEATTKVEITTEEPSTVIEEVKQDVSWNGPVINAYNGTVQGPSGKETYYNLDMSGVLSIMRNIGNTDQYWVRDDGMKMLGDYIMVAADLSIRPRGSLVPTSRGMGIVCDTGSFIYSNPYQLDLAVTW